MKPYEMIQEFVKDKLMTDDTKFEVTKLVEKVITFERERCAGVAERVASYYSANNGDSKDVALLVAQEIREGK